jgi:energy-coupling factor transporter ATP-binding protein EcfA2
MASLLISEPELLLLDDPFAGLDPEKLEHILNLLYVHSEEKGTAIVLATHSSKDYQHWGHYHRTLETNTSLKPGAEQRPVLSAVQA